MARLKTAVKYKLRAQGQEALNLWHLFPSPIINKMKTKMSN